MKKESPERTQWPSSTELEFLTPSYKFIYDIFDEINEEAFWAKDPYYRLSRVRDALLIYSELLEYKPIDFIIGIIRKLRPQIEAELSREYLLFIRNLLIHFPFFKKWDDVEFRKSLINWSESDKSIDRFLTRHSGMQTIKYRTWDTKNKQMTHVAIKLPTEYSSNALIRLTDIVGERDGIKSIMNLMKSILNSQMLP